jgi:hypothetical protein
VACCSTTDVTAEPSGSDAVAVGSDVAVAVAVGSDVTVAVAVAVALGSDVAVVVGSDVVVAVAVGSAVGAVVAGAVDVVVVGTGAGVTVVVGLFGLGAACAVTPRVATKTAAASPVAASALLRIMCEYSLWSRLAASLVPRG